MQIQKDLDDYKTLNPEFPVSHHIIALRTVTNCAKRNNATVAHDELPTSIGLVCGRSFDGPGRAVLARIHLSGYDQRSLTCAGWYNLYVRTNSPPCGLFSCSADQYLSLSLRHKVKTGMGVIEERTDILSEEDKIWTQIRHMHMKEAIDKLMADFNKFQQEHAGFRAG